MGRDNYTDADVRMSKMMETELRPYNDQMTLFG